MTQTIEVSDNWFYYWKTSSSLWKEKLESFPFNSVVIPIFWAFHTEKQKSFDFGTKRPETNLKRIYEIGKELGKRIIFFLPLSPAPIFPHGGLPASLIGTISQNLQGHAYAVLNKERMYNKLYSFFDPNVFKEFGTFVKELGHYFVSEKINSDIYGINCGYFFGKSFVSYFGDRSNCFHKSFAKFIEASMEENLTLGIKSPEQEREEIKKFTTFIFNLYKKTAMENLSQNWEGDLKVVFLGGSSKDFIRRSLSDDNLDYFNEILYGVYQEFLPSMALLNTDSESKIFSRQFKDIVIDAYMPYRLSSSFMEDTNYSPLSFFQIMEDHEHSFEKVGLLKLLEENYGRTFSYFSYDEEKELSLSNDGRVFFISGKQIDKRKFTEILKFFLNGGKVFIDCNDLPLDIKNKLDSFLLENSLKVDKIKYYANFENVSLGEGRLFLFKSGEFQLLDNDKKREFWQKVLVNLDIPHFHLDPAPQLKFFWKTRTASPQELNYQEVRRLCVYNSEKNKIKVRGQIRRNISLIKVGIDGDQKYEISSDRVEFEIPQHSWITVDFGVWA